MGKAAIGSRTMNGQTYPAFARWAVLDAQGREMPVQDEAVLARFRTTFRLARTDEPGLSVVIPLPKVPPDPKKLRELVLREWLVPILRGRLVVDIAGQMIDAASAAVLAPAVLGPKVAAFVAEVATPKREPVELPELRHPLGKLVADRLGPQVLGELRAAYGRREIVTVRVPVALFPKETGERRGHMRLSLQQGDAKQEPFALRLRGDISVPDAAKLNVEGVASALVAEDGPLADFLADAEPPAHDTWIVTEQLKKSWRNARDTLPLIRSAPVRLHALLAVGAEDEVPDALLDFFWFEDDAAPKPPTPGGGPKPKPPQPAPPPEPPAPRPRQLVIEPRNGGFVLKAGPGLAAAGLPCRIRLRMAYDLEEGDPFKKWSPLDFDLDDEQSGIGIEAEAADVVERRGNALVIEAREPDFRVEVEGFDPHRDLEVRVHRLAEPGP
jgi:hypothetical protein